MSTKVRKIIGIDASNLYSGGSKTHLRLFLTEYLKTDSYEDTKIIIFLFSNLKVDFPNGKNLEYVYINGNGDSPRYRFFWQHLYSYNYYRRYGIDVLFVPGGGYLGRFRPFVVMCRNMLLFETDQSRLYGSGVYRLKYLVLKWIQLISYRNSDHLIYISKYAQEYLQNRLRTLSKVDNSVVHHGIAKYFQDIWSPREIGDRVRLIYVSAIEPYKRHLELLAVVEQLNEIIGKQLELVFVGKRSNLSYTQRVDKKASQLVNLGVRIEFIENAGHSELGEILKTSDFFIFPSTCENMPNALLEAQITGMPGASSNIGASSEFIFDKTIGFNPLDQEEFRNALFQLIDNNGHYCGRKTKEIASMYDWSITTAQTMEILTQKKG